MYPQSMLWSKNHKNMEKVLLKFFDFYNIRKIYTLHGRVFVMFNGKDNKLKSFKDRAMPSWVLN